ncbi:phytanoyl-CoA dioxygenase family protein [Marinomonas mediterranea]|jgi:Phytanoyl-CoA dioxygenase (PhyH).|uniref:Phytanoyl-CoA dioxygenase n=1 Tax=Marinomonas mediterranea (strain ATCC 700492 / JCM 21426 / NBRC 103028 / MMB-1) TaxID=717774 RepID=F2K3S7_MARM1|nr:phytanoyl-CoA dioxygenase family protein [Marinomonas mediterranea]ADZ90176.1 Phytanoyl-CoA dioxygenase [Marinomonas mediterranea MMB-1]WCN08237.1 phytanoyl-CoA dioxygenase [Marinomonas mediterranea]WCN12303.1 phytanoyl-CoA dioxygenase [Marinomonas mediterranea]WCN16375.1 phytanoyl-CoA dioxygenase [Marinomonas mediterranea MMB-1]
MDDSKTIKGAHVEQYQQQGFTLYENAMPHELLTKLQTLADTLEKKALDTHHAGQKAPHACVVQDPAGPRLMRYDDIFLNEMDATLDLLATPAMINITKELCGDGSIPLQCDILYKHQHPHPVINWHQDAQHPKNYPYLNIGIYLDDANLDDGCLKYVPETQHELLDIQTLSEKHGWNIPGVVEQPAKAGDILVQDMMILHGSAPKRTEGSRRTIYVELRPSNGVRESGRQSERWITLREQWMALVIERADPTLIPAHWFDLYPVGKVDKEVLIADLEKYKEPPIPGVWATFPVDHPDYPVPSDMR